MLLVQVHKPISMNKHDFQSLMTCNLIGKTPGAVILMLQNHTGDNWIEFPWILDPFSCGILTLNEPANLK